jgi:tetratricopeptide (TPR) repeat protein
VLVTGLTVASRALLSGQRRLGEGDVAGALERFEAAARAAPAWGVARLWLGAAAGEAGDLERARRELERAVELGAEPIVARVWLARAYFDHRAYTEALETLEAMADGGERNLHVASFRALLRWTAEGDAGALADVAWRVGLGNGELLGRWLVETEERFPGGPGTDFPAARPEPAARRGLGLGRRRALRLRARARARLAAGEPIRALADVDRADALHPGAAADDELRVAVHHAAADARRAALNDAPHDVELRLDLAESLLEVGLASEAARTLGPVEEHIDAIDAGRLTWRATAALLRGRARLGSGEVADAAADLARARELWPFEVEPIYYHGVALLRCGRRAAGRRAMVDACHMDGGLAQGRLDELRAALGGVDL